MIATIALLHQAASILPTDSSALERSISALESCISALDSKVESLTKSLPSIEHWGWVCTAAVAIGVLMEFVVIWHDHREDVEIWALKFAFGVDRVKRPSVWKVTFEYISVLLVAGGILGELATGIQIASINVEVSGYDIQLRTKNGELRSKSDQLLALVTQQAGSAKKSAEDTEKDFKGVDTEAKNLGIELNSAFSRLGQVEDETERLGPRADSVIANKSAFVKALKPFSATQFSIMTCGPRTLEESGLVTILSYALGHSGAGWDTYAFGDQKDVGETESFFSGVEVFENQYDNVSKQAGHELVKELNAIKIDAGEVAVTQLPQVAPAPGTCSINRFWGMSQSIVVRVGYNPAESPNLKVFQKPTKQPSKIKTQK